MLFKLALPRDVAANPLGKTGSKKGKVFIMTMELLIIKICANCGKPIVETRRNIEENHMQQLVDRYSRAASFKYSFYNVKSGVFFLESLCLACDLVEVDL